MVPKPFTIITSVLAALFLAESAYCAEFTLVTGVDPLLMPGSARTVVPQPGPGFPGTFTDGDRLAGTSETEAPATFDGLGVPLFTPNEFGALSFAFRRGSVPIPQSSNQVPILGIDFLGGPLVDLDGDLGNSSRSLVPVTGQSAVVIPNSRSTIDLIISFDNLAVDLWSVDISGNNGGGSGIGPDIATTINVLAGTSSDGLPGSPINPSVDTRLGDLIPFSGNGSLAGVFRIDNLGYEIWQDSIDPASSSAAQLGSFQFLGSFRGWLVLRDPNTGQFPTLAGQGLGSTRWPEVATALVGQTFNTANGLVGGSASIDDGAAEDVFSSTGNGGLSLSDSGGDLGAYFDTVVIPALNSGTNSFVYLESAGVGINNSFDPVFRDSTGYDIVLVAESTCFGPNNVCDRPVPAANQWGILMLALVLLATATMVIARSRRDSPSPTN